MANIVDLAKPSLEKAKDLVKTAKKKLYEAETQALLYLTEEFMIAFIKRNFIACIVYMAASIAKQDIVADIGEELFDNYITSGMLTPIVPRLEPLIMHILEEEDYENDYFSLRVITGEPYKVVADVMYSEIETTGSWTYTREHQINEEYDLFAKRMIAVFLTNYNEIVKDYIEKNVTERDLEQMEDDDNSDDVTETIEYIENNYDIQEGDD